MRALAIGISVLAAHCKCSCSKCAHPPVHAHCALLIAHCSSSSLLCLMMPPICKASPGAESAAWAKRERDMAARKQAKLEANKPKFGLHMLKKKGERKGQGKASAARTPLSSVENVETPTVG